RHERGRALHVPHARAADVDGLERLEEAQRRDCDPAPGAGRQDRGAFRNGHAAAVDRERDGPSAHLPPPYRFKRLTADSIAEYAVWPRPQIDASFIAAPTSSSSASSEAIPVPAPAPPRRCSASSCPIGTTRTA